ncbi:hypothetical protein LP585_24150, partial [Escherichia coli]|uniref:hypothetical protein n=1 Tax=Escherichia coli TaxID=562 RepID=UPI0020410543
LMMSLWDALRMNMMISYQELVRTFPSGGYPLFRLHTSALSVSLNQVREKSLFPVYIVERCLGQKPGITPASRHNISRVHVAMKLIRFFYGG